MILCRRREISPPAAPVVNGEHTTAARAVPVYSNIPATVSDEHDNRIPCTSQPMTSLPKHMRSCCGKTHSPLPLLSERHCSSDHDNQVYQSHHHQSLTGESWAETHHQTDTSAASSSRSPDLHYYHVLERPEYYNWDWLVQGESGSPHKLLLRGASRNNNRKVTIGEHDGNNDSQYHWNVVLTTSPNSAKEDQNLNRSTSSKRVGRHLYQRLDHFTLEPLQDYTKVIIGHHNDESHT